jgi:hypothetical protein
MLTLFNDSQHHSFKVSVYSEPGVDPAGLAVSGLKSGGPLLDKATIRCIMDRTKQPKLIEAGKEILLYREVRHLKPFRGSFINDAMFFCRV